MNNEHSRINADAQLKSTHALLKFCQDHNYKSTYIENIKTCISALEDGNIQSAVKSYRAIPLGGNGCFNDWWHPVVYEHETDEYVLAVFNALLAEWSRLMQLNISKVRP